MKYEVRGSPYKQVRGLSRGLEVLRALNRFEGAHCSAVEIGEMTRLPRATVHRLLETLLAAGYLRKGADPGQFRLTSEVGYLSSGLTISEHIASVAAPVMEEMQLRIRWPSMLSVADEGMMLFVEVTRGESPLVLQDSMLGRRQPMLLCGSGRAYFSWLPPRTRQKLLQRFCAHEDLNARVAANERQMSQLVQKIRTDGFAQNTGYWKNDPLLGSIAMPVLLRNRPVASLNVMFPIKEIKVADAARLYLPSLRAAVGRIASGIPRQAWTA